VIVFALLAFVAVNAEPEKVCFQAPESCSELRDAAKSYIRGALAPPTGYIEQDAPKALEHLQKLFSLAAKYDCKVDSCRCNAGKLECAHVADKVRAGLAKREPPACVAASEKASARLDALREAVKADNRQAIADNIGELRADLITAIDDKNSDVVACLKETVITIRAGLKEKLKELEIQKSCDFCQA